MMKVIEQCNTVTSRVIRRVIFHNLYYYFNRLLFEYFNDAYIVLLIDLVSQMIMSWKRTLLRVPH